MTSPEQDRSTKRGAAGIVLHCLIIVAVFLTLFLCFTFPLCTRFGNLVLSDTPHGISDDTITHVWYWWYLKANLWKIVNRPATLWKTDLLFAPYGFDLRIPLSNLGPLMVLFPAIGIYPFPYNANLYVLTIIVLNGVFVYYMLRKMNMGALPATLGGAMVAINPYFIKTAVAGKGDQAIIWFTALAMATIPETLELGGRKRVLWCTFFMLLASLCYWFHGLFLGIFLLLALVTATGKARSGTRLKPLARAAAVVLLLITFSLPFLLPHIREGISRGHAMGVTADTVVPLKFPPVSSEQDAVSRQDTISGAPSGQLAIVPDHPLVFWKNPLVIIQLFLIIPALFIPKRRVFWIVTVAVFYLLSLGPYLTLPGTHITLILPFALVYAVIPFTSRLIETGRFAAITYPALAVISAGAFSALAHRLHLRTKGQIAVCAVCLAVAVTVCRVQGVVRLEKAPAIPPGISEIKSTEVETGTENGMVIDVPFYSNEVCARAMWYQTVHERPLLTGPGAGLWFIRSRELNELVNGDQLLRYLSTFGLTPPGDFVYSADHIARLRDMGYRYVFFHKLSSIADGQQSYGQQSDRDLYRHWFHRSVALGKALGCKPSYQSKTVDIYDLARNREEQ